MRRCSFFFLCVLLSFSSFSQSKEKEVLQNKKAKIQKEILKYGKLFRFGPEFFEKIRNKDIQISYLKSKEFQHILKQKVNVFVNNMMIKQFIEKASPESALLHRFVK